MTALAVTTSIGACASHRRIAGRGGLGTVPALAGSPGATPSPAVTVTVGTTATATSTTAHGGGGGGGGGKTPTAGTSSPSTASPSSPGQILLTGIVNSDYSVQVGHPCLWYVTNDGLMQIGAPVLFFYTGFGHPASLNFQATASIAGNVYNGVVAASYLESPQGYTRDVYVGNEFYNYFDDKTITMTITIYPQGIDPNPSNNTATIAMYVPAAGKPDPGGTIVLPICSVQ
jgi:hypothetical protein